ncbi:hypothetical protein [Hydrogenophaga sp.]|uniref:hypothetical protein n=1 Tax=Hydrogenophaga sp. TaxID=1904254 RepID=UPI00273120E5|nr:hypothetical protein [Hydrogenophaga sp.]MDP1684627.1 hypothetical protein [Hydrogenophaga sp.]
MDSASYSERKQIAANALPPLQEAVPPSARRKIALAFANFFRNNQTYWNVGQGEDAVEKALKKLSVSHGEDFGAYPTTDQLLDYMQRPELLDEQFLDCVEYAMEAAAGLALFDREVSWKATHEVWGSLRRDVNRIFTMSGAGYELTDISTIVPKSSDALHSQVIEPALLLTRRPGFASTNECYMKAIDCLRKGDTKEACTNARRALESALKTIAKQQGDWKGKGGAALSDKAQLKELIQAALASRLLPSSWEATFNGFRPFLESTVPSVTNPPSHGSAEPLVVPKEIAEFAIASVAAVLVLLIERST